ncbi:amino acid permease-domain-containing protein [Mycena pura]|uniref:Amino acid permease-domain-containing protein n=1 Tax=Mycena pura TaxID=153505 RepID=A0AAD6YVS8_9AGAR|nr:amino acid permease-domain-containing protein [Mycena pura]
MFPSCPPPDMGDDGEHGTEPNLESWIAIEPIARAPDAEGPSQSADPPTFHESRFDIILRRQRTRPPDGSGLKHPLVPSSRFLNLSSDFEFAGWGSFTRLKLTPEDYIIGEERLQRIRRAMMLGQWMGSALPGTAVLGGIFYTVPAVVAVSGVYSPISLFIATLTLFLWRPIMEELASAFPISGAPYSYLLNVSRKSLALFGAALLLLDFASTAVLSAATASAYVAGEVDLPFPVFVGAALVLAIFALVSLTGIKESSRIAAVVLACHVATMAALGIAASVHWARSGNAQLRGNWKDGAMSSGAAVARQVFNGFCLGMLGLTGVECTPSYAGRVKSGRFPLVLRNLHLPAIFLNTLMITLVFATIPLQTVLSGANVLSVLAEMSAGPWLRKWIVVDATVVLCGGVLTGILSACELFEQLALDRILPQVFLNVLPLSDAPYISILAITALNAVFYASAGASVAVVSKMFSLVWLIVMGLFPLSLLLLRFNRGRVPREHSTSLSVIALTLVLTTVVFAGVVAIDPSTAGYFAAYLIGVLLVFGATQNQVRLLRAVYWAYDQYPALHRWRASGAWGRALVRVMARLRQQPVCVLAKTDEINHLLHMLLYVRDNEETSCVKLVHFCDPEHGVPSELEANAKSAYFFLSFHPSIYIPFCASWMLAHLSCAETPVLDEAFPEITIDLIIVQGTFTPANVASLAHRLQIPQSLMFMSCPGPWFAHPVAEFGTRIISL